MRAMLNLCKYLTPVDKQKASLSLLELPDRLFLDISTTTN